MSECLSASRALAKAIVWRAARPLLGLAQRAAVVARLARLSQLTCVCVSGRRRKHANLSEAQNGSLRRICSGSCAHAAKLKVPEVMRQESISSQAIAERPIGLLESFARKPCRSLAARSTPISERAKLDSSHAAANRPPRSISRCRVWRRAAD